MMPTPKVLLIGSSIFAQWFNAAEAFPGAQVVNAAIGGTTTHDWLTRLRPALDEHGPDIVCMYCGSNDLNHGRLADEIVGNLAACRSIVASYNADVRYVYFSIIKAPQKGDVLDRIDAVHTALEAVRPAADRFVDLNRVFHVDGQTPPELFVEDGVHLTATAYQRMVQTTRDQLADMF